MKMTNRFYRIASTSAMVAATMLFMVQSGPAFADVKAGVDAWSAGDYDRAVREWRGPAADGDADAQFNMAQAYRLGRGVDTNIEKAESLYQKAANQGHIKAADNYGLVLFQQGRRQQALPYVTAASGRGDPRAQYLLGVAHFNGDMVEKDWTRAYALMTLSNGAGLPQAQAAIGQMDSHIPLEQRQEAQVMAQRIKADSNQRRAQQLASADLNNGRAIQAAPSSPSSPANYSPMNPGAAIGSVGSVGSVGNTGSVGNIGGAGSISNNRIPRPIASTPIPPSVVAAQRAIAEAARVTGTETPALAGADFARPNAPSPRPQPAAQIATRPAQAVNPPQVTAATSPSTSPSTSYAANAASGGKWRVQLGAFSVRGNAENLWSRASRNPALRGAQKLLLPTGRIVRLQAGYYPSRNAAQNVCNRLKSSGQTCIVTSK